MDGRDLLNAGVCSPVRGGGRRAHDTPLRDPSDTESANRDTSGAGASRWPGTKGRAPGPARGEKRARSKAPGAGIEPASYPHSKCGRPYQQSNPGMVLSVSVGRSTPQFRMGAEF